MSAYELSASLPVKNSDSTRMTRKTKIPVYSLLNNGMQIRFRRYMFHEEHLHIYSIKIEYFAIFFLRYYCIVKHSEYVYTRLSVIGITG